METDLKSYRSEFVPVSCNQGLKTEDFSVYHHALLNSRIVWDPPHVLFSEHGTEATDTYVKAREKSAVKLFATCQLCSVGGRWIVWFSFLSVNLLHSVLSNAALSNPRNCLLVALFLGTFRMCFRRQRGFHFQQNYHDSCTTTTRLKFFNTTRSWARCYRTCFQVLLHYLTLHWWVFFFFFSVKHPHQMHWISLR